MLGWYTVGEMVLVAERYGMSLAVLVGIYIVGWWNRAKRRFLGNLGMLLR